MFIKSVILAMLLAMSSNGAAFTLNLEPKPDPYQDSTELIEDLPDVPVHFAFWDMDSIKPKVCIIFTVSGMQCEIIDPFTSRLGINRELP